MKQGGKAIIKLRRWILQVTFFMLILFVPFRNTEAAKKKVTLRKNTTIYLRKGQKIRVNRGHRWKIYPKNNRTIRLTRNGNLFAKNYGQTKIKGPRGYQATVKVLHESDFCHVNRPERSAVLTEYQRQDFQTIWKALLRNNDGELIFLHNVSEATDLWYVMTGDSGLQARNGVGENMLMIMHTPDNAAYASGEKGCYRYMAKTYQILREKMRINNQTPKKEAVRKIYQYISDHAIYDYDDANRIMRRHSTYISPSQRFDGIINHGKGVCSAYSQLFQIFCAEAGIPCRLKRGYVSKQRRSSDYHQWDQIKLGKRNYDVDPTEEPTPKSHKQMKSLRSFKLQSILNKSLYHKINRGYLFGPEAAVWYYEYK